MRDYLFFGGILALALLTYDLLTLLLYLAGYELLFKRRRGPIGISAALAIGIYVAFGMLTAHMTSFVHDDRNSKYIEESITAAIAALRSKPLTLNSYGLYGGLLTNYIWNLSNAVFVFPLAVAIVGLFSLDKSPKLKLAGLLFLPSLAGAAFLYLGQSNLATLPRFTFIAYPVVYILCSVALWTVARLAASRWIGTLPKYVAAAVALCGVVLHIALVNADVFGYPWLYYLFYYQQLTPAHF
jgi:hypothetical protein